MTRVPALDHVADPELLARFVMRESWVRADGTVRQDAFISPPDLQLSVSRHTGQSQDGIWARGHAVARARETQLFGRADLMAASVRAAGASDSTGALDVVAAPLSDDPLHAHIIGWPAGDKPRQKILAQLLAAASLFKRAPVTPTA